LKLIVAFILPRINEAEYNILANYPMR